MERPSSEVGNREPHSVLEVVDSGDETDASNYIDSSDILDLDNTIIRNYDHTDVIVRANTNPHFTTRDTGSVVRRPTSPVSAEARAATQLALQPSVSGAVESDGRVTDGRGQKCHVGTRSGGIESTRFSIDVSDRPSMERNRQSMLVTFVSIHQFR